MFTGYVLRLAHTSFCVGTGTGAFWPPVRNPLTSSLMVALPALPPPFQFSVSLPCLLSKSSAFLYLLCLNRRACCQPWLAAPHQLWACSFASLLPAVVSLCPCCPFSPLSGSSLLSCHRSRRTQLSLSWSSAETLESPGPCASLVSLSHSGHTSFFSLETHPSSLLSFSSSFPLSLLPSFLSSSASKIEVSIVQHRECSQYFVITLNGK